MDTKLKGDLAESAAVVHALKQGFGVLKPIGDRLPYDLVFDCGKSLCRIQVKHTWRDAKSGNYVIDSRRTKTNRQHMKRERYSDDDFDFALAYVAENDLFYIMPAKVFNEYKSEIHFVESQKRQRKPKSANFRDAWNLIFEWAAQRASVVSVPVKFGEASRSGNPEPSPVSGKV